MMGHAATTAMRINDGVTITFASLRSGMPFDRRRAAGEGAGTDAASMFSSALERVERAVDLRVRLLDGGLRAGATRESVVDVLVDRLRDLRIDRRDRARVRLAQGLQQLGRVRDGLLDI